MLMGHYSSALVAKRIAPSLSLPLLFVSSQLIDFFWGILVLFGIEKLHVIPGFNPSNPLDLYFMPYTHSLPAAIIWSGGAAVLYYLFAKTPVHRVRNALLIGANDIEGTTATITFTDFTVGADGNVALSQRLGGRVAAAVREQRRRRRRGEFVE